jgi:uracil-DNA glycosylase
MKAPSLASVAREARACTLCAAELPLGPRPVFRLHPKARLLIVGQAPGTKVHATGLPWNDRSGDRLRDWLQLDREQFYDQRKIAILPMGLCYPGVDAKGGDRPPMAICAPTWHPRLRPLLPEVRLTLLVGLYAQRHYLGTQRLASLGETVRNFAAYLPAFLPLPHPSWRNTAWLRRNAWFESDLLPRLREQVAALLC